MDSLNWGKEVSMNRFLKQLRFFIFSTNSEINYKITEKFNNRILRTYYLINLTGIIENNSYFRFVTFMDKNHELQKDISRVLNIVPEDSVHLRYNIDENNKYIVRMYFENGQITIEAN
jgi:hypothetical protein